MRLPPPSYEDDTTPLEQLQLDSDVQVWNKHPNPADTHSCTVGFPLLCTPTNSGDTDESTDDTDKNSATTALSSKSSSFLCTQGVGGQLTHFFAGNLHAIDFRCPVGTPIVAVGNGTIIDVQTKNTALSGIAVSNLFNWNSILLQIDTTTITNDDNTSQHQEEATVITQNTPTNDLDSQTIENSIHLNEFKKNAIGGPLYVEYVHIATSLVQVGDVVTEGQIIGTSGSIGFSPEPHLHFAAYRSNEPTAPTCRVYFHTKHNKENMFLPTAGNYYNDNGLVVSSTTSPS
jgi:murein DD-endopeptidase MepM/ murein hydrolase activator NlpD